MENQAGKSAQKTVLSIEQALSMPYATLRFVHLGWRVIRVEATSKGGGQRPGDPNRYIGRKVAGEDRFSYYVAPNAGKEAIALDLKEPEGRELLHRIVRELPVDLVCTNTLPAHHQKLGIDYASLKRQREDLIWCGISAMGASSPKVPGYDPMMQALCGYMDLTGAADGPPMLTGIPLIDLKAGDEAFTQSILALMERQETGKGRMIDISMAHAAVSWMHTFLPMLEMGSRVEEIRRSGNEHRQFIPVNSYRTADGYLYVAIGSDVQWRRFVARPMFSSLDCEQYASNEGRRSGKQELHRSIEEITRKHACQEVADELAAAGVPHSPITPINEVLDLPFVKQTSLTTRTPDGKLVRLPPPAVPTDFLSRSGGELSFAPAYGEQTAAVLREVGLSQERIDALAEQGIISV